MTATSDGARGDGAGDGEDARDATRARDDGAGDARASGRDDDDDDDDDEDVARRDALDAAR